MGLPPKDAGAEAADLQQVVQIGGFSPDVFF
jgi:hypothetical protein